MQDDKQTTAQEARERAWLEIKLGRPLTARDRKAARRNAERLVSETERRLFGRRVS